MAMMQVYVGSGGSIVTDPKREWHCNIAIGWLDHDRIDSNVRAHR